MLLLLVLVILLANAGVGVVLELIKNDWDEEEGGWELGKKPPPPLDDGIIGDPLAAATESKLALVEPTNGLNWFIENGMVAAALSGDWFHCSIVGRSPPSFDKPLLLLLLEEPRSAGLLVEAPALLLLN